MRVRSQAVRAAQLILAAGLIISACKCDTPPLNSICDGGQCCEKIACTAPETYCDLSTEKCVSDVHQCDLLVDAGPPSAANTCCPGEICNDIISQCIDSYTGCTPDGGTCAVPGQYCNPKLGVNQVGPGCTFPVCDYGDAGTCPSGLSCFDTYCIGSQPPCGGGCPSGEVCTPVNNQCFKLTDPSSTCLQSCSPGTLLVFTDGQNVFDHCDFAEEAYCSCETLPGLSTYDGARYSQAVVAGSQILVSAYDGEYGDLILHTFDKTTQAELSSSPQWIDGVPASGTVTGNPQGPRNGISTPGPDVGRYTSIAYDSAHNATHIAYYAAATDGSQDVPVATATPIGALRYARRIGNGPWTIIDTVDGTTDGDVGLYTSITLASDGSPVIAYFQRAGSGANSVVTALKIARAKNATPMSASDWTITPVDTGSNAADSGSMTVNIPAGNGLMPSIAYLDSLPVVVWYDHTNGQLKGEIASDDSAMNGVTFSGNIQVLDDGTGGGAYTTAHDVGRFPSLAIGPASATQRIAVAYFDATARQALLLTAKSDWSNMTAEGSTRIIDSGAVTPAAGSDDRSLSVGANSSVQFVNGNLEVVYQDSTGGTLRFAKQTSPSAAVKYVQSYAATATSPGAAGFYASLTVDSTGAYVSHATIYAAGPSTPNNHLAVVKLP